MLGPPWEEDPSEDDGKGRPSGPERTCSPGTRITVKVSSLESATLTNFR